ncbi:hypothetical protein CCUS01_13454 [Colletotrichum cuscutae]|uniref:Uncharacterized protein n=1 Tax=Colletotrichum cuscutae TaxID=1209917 RepID=A0AAJ0DNJ7_9PEZI|nr:hypothetical protein CCUS01_13454 [Colletotrichum cuscutae]
MEPLQSNVISGPEMGPARNSTSSTTIFISLSLEAKPDTNEDTITKKTEKPDQELYKLNSSSRATNIHHGNGHQTDSREPVVPSNCSSKIHTQEPHPHFFDTLNMTDANTRGPSSLDGTPCLPLQESEPRPSIVETPSRQVLNGSHVDRERPWSRDILPDDFLEYQRQLKLRLCKAHEAGVQWNDIHFDAEWCLPSWEGIDPADLKPGEGITLWKWSGNGKVSHDSNKESKPVADQPIKALKELFDKELSGDNRYHESLTKLKLKYLAEMLDGYPVAKQDFEDAIQPVREAIDVWHEIFAKMGAKSVPIAEADLVSDFGNPISPFLGLPADSTTWVDFLRKLIGLKEWDFIQKVTSIQNQAHFRYLMWAEKLIKSYEGDESNLMNTGNRRKVDEKPPNAEFEKGEDIATEKPTPKQPIVDKSHNDDRENEDIAAFEASLLEPVEEYLRIVAEQSKESESEPTASQSNPQNYEADDEMIIDEETLNDMFSGWIGHMPIARGLDEVEDEEEDGNEEASWFIE